MQTTINCPNCQSEMSQLFGAHHAGCTSCGHVLMDAFTLDTETPNDLIDQCRDLIKRAEYHISLVTGDAPFLVERTENWRELVKDSLADVNAAMLDHTNPQEPETWYALQDVRDALEQEYVRLYFAQYPTSQLPIYAVRELARAN